MVELQRGLHDMIVFFVPCSHCSPIDGKKRHKPEPFMRPLGARLLKSRRRKSKRWSLRRAEGVEHCCSKVTKTTHLVKSF